MNLEINSENKDTFCILPFNHLYVEPDGRTAPCCIGGKFDNVNIKKQTIEEAFNTPEYLELRKNLTSGVRDAICKNCWDVEDLGLTSYRQVANSRIEEEWYSLPVVDGDFKLEPKIEYIDIRFSNLCNLQCRMCHHIYSSNLYEFNKKLNRGTYDEKVVTVGNNFMEDLNKYLPGVKSVYFAGGEPLIMPEHKQVLTELHRLGTIKKEKENLDLIPIEIHYNTNLKVLKNDGLDFIELWKDFKRVNICISVDGVDSVGEYQRVGFDTETFYTNTYKLLNNGFKSVHTHKKGNNLLYNFQYTVTTINVLHLYKFVDTLLDKKIIDNAALVDFRHTTGPEEFSIRNHPDKGAVREYLLTGVGKYGKDYDIKIDGLIKYLNMPPTITRLELDNRMTDIEDALSTKFEHTYTDFLKSNRSI